MRMRISVLAVKRIFNNSVTYQNYEIIKGMDKYITEKGMAIDSLL